MTTDLTRRRALVAGASAVVAAGLPVAATATVPAPEDPDAPLWALLAELRSLVDKQDRLVDEARRTGDAGLTARVEDLNDERGELEVAIMRTPAYTLAGLAAKARLADEIEGEDPDGSQAPLASGPMLRTLAADLERLAGAARL